MTYSIVSVYRVTIKESESQIDVSFFYQAKICLIRWHILMTVYKTEHHKSMFNDY